MLARSIALGLVIVGLAACAARVAERRVEQCSAGAWSAPRQLTVGTDGLVHVEYPQMVATRGGLTFFGDNAVVLRVSDSGFQRVAGWPRGPGMIAGVMRRPSGAVEPVPLPHHLRAFVAPRGIGDREGNAHFFWGESPDTTPNQSDHVRGIWYARFDGHRWSRPEHVIEEPSLRWFSVFTGIAAIGNDVFLVAPVFGNDVHHIVFVRRYADGRISVRRLPFQGAYTTLTALADGTLLLGLVQGGAEAHPPTRDRTLVTVVRSNDRGESWEPPVVVHRAPFQGSYVPRFIETSRSVFAIWEGSSTRLPADELAFPVSGEKHDSVQAALSADGGRTWTRVAGIPVPDGASGLEAVRGPDDRARVVFELLGASDSNPPLVTTSLTAAGWRGPDRLGAGPYPPSLAAPFRDSLVVAWAQWQSAGPERVPFIHWATYRCRRSS